MTNPATPAADTGLPKEITERTAPRRVPYRSYEQSGKVFCNEALWRAEVLRVTSEREQLAAYRASLPTDPVEALNATRNVLHHDQEEFPEGFERAFHTMAILEQVLQAGDLDMPAVLESVRFMSSKAVDDLHATREALLRVGDILDEAGRARREETPLIRDLLKWLADYTAMNATGENDEDKFNAMVEASAARLRVLLNTHASTEREILFKLAMNLIANEMTLEGTTADEIYNATGVRVRSSDAKKRLE